MALITREQLYIPVEGSHLCNGPSVAGDRTDTGAAFGGAPRVSYYESVGAYFRSSLLLRPLGHRIKVICLISNKAARQSKE